MPVAMSLTRGSEHSRPCSSASSAPCAGGEHAEPGRAAQVGAAEAGHRREHQHAFEAEVDAARLLGQALAEADEQERRADAQRAADDRQRGTASECVAGHAALAFAAAIGGAGSPARRGALAHSRNGRPVDAAQRLARQDQHEGDALQHQHRRVGQAEPALQQAAGGAEAAEQDRDRDDRQRVVARDERHQDAGVAVAGDQRGVGVGVHRRDLDRAGQARAGAAERAGQQRSAGSPAGPTSCAVRGLPPTTRTAKPRRREAQPQRRRPTQATTPSTRPQCTSEPAMPPMRRPLGERAGRRLVQARRIAQRPFDQCLKSAIAM